MNRSRFVIHLVFLSLLAIPAFAQMGTGGHPIDHNLIFPHLAVGEGYDTSLLFMNPGLSERIDGILYIYTQLGTPMNVSYNGSLVSQIPISLPGGGTRNIQVNGTSENLMVGWALFEVQTAGGGSGMGAGNASGMGSGMNMDPHAHVFGSVIFSHQTGNAVDTQVGVTATRYEMGNFMGISIPVMAGVDTGTGVAVVNAGSGEAAITFVLVDPDGNQVAETARTLASGNQMAYMVTDLFPDVSSTSVNGSVEIRTSQEGIVSIGLLVTGNVLTSIPVVHIPDSMPDSGMNGGGMHGGGSGGGSGPMM